MTAAKKAPKKNIKSSRGRRYNLSRSKPTEKVKKAAVSDLNLISELKYCCDKECIFKHFASDVDSRFGDVVKLLREGMKETYGFNKEERNEFLYRQFKATVTNAPSSGEGPTKGFFQHDWTIPKIGDIMCRQCWGHYYGFSPYSMDDCSKSLKLDWSLTGRAQRAYTDETNHEFYYDDMKEVLAKKLGEGWMTP